MTDLIAARDEVGWFFTSAESAMGLRAQAYEGGGGVCWDEARCERAHAALLSVGHRAAVSRYERVLATLGRLPRGTFLDLASVYTPFGAARTSWQAYCCFSQGGRPLLGLALRTPQLRMAYARKKSSVVAPAFADLLRFVEREVSHLDYRTIRPGHALPRGHRLEPALRAADGREIAAAAAYDDLRRARVGAEAEARKALLDAHLDALRIKLWGSPY